jgi:hypothetical protein
MFKTLDESYKSRVKVGNGEFLEVKGRGSVNGQTSSGIKIIPNVLFIPEISQKFIECWTNDGEKTILFSLRVINALSLILLENKCSV